MLAHALCWLAAEVMLLVWQSTNGSDAPLGMTALDTEETCWARFRMSAAGGRSVSPIFQSRLAIRDKPIAPGSPWQNGFAERLTGSIRRECVDHLVVLGEPHLRRILTNCATYYNELRTHRSLNKDAPIRRAIQHVGRIVSAPVLCCLHHHYCRI